jgi:transposase-like protein
MECSCGKGMRKNGFYKSRQRWRCKTCNDSFQEGNLRPRVSASDAIKFQKLASRGTTLTAISEAFGCSRQCVAYQLKKKTDH